MRQPSLQALLMSWPIVVLLPYLGRVHGTPPDLSAILDYGTFRGAYSLEYNISYWNKIPYAAPPTGRNRFVSFFSVQMPSSPHIYREMVALDDSLLGPLFTSCAPRPAKSMLHCIN